MDASAAKLIGAGLATIALAGVGVGIGNIFGSFVSGALRNPEAAPRVFGNVLLGFALTEAVGAVRAGHRLHAPVRVLSLRDRGLEPAIMRKSVYGALAAASPPSPRRQRCRGRRHAAARRPRLRAAARLAGDRLRGRSTS